MNHIHAIGRLAGVLAWLASALLALFAAAPAALANPRPRPPGWDKHPPLPVGTQPAIRFPPGWNKHPPLPAHVHPLAAAGLPGWQISLIVAVAVLAAAALAVAAYRVRAVRRRVNAAAA
jgi:hypothetical protein